jgi:hypothetical protein
LKAPLRGGDAASMPSHFATEPTLSPNGRPMRPNGKNEKCDTVEFAELPIEAAEPYANAYTLSLEWQT